MRIASAVGTWRAVAQRHRAARVLRGWRLEERLRLLTSAATVKTLIEEVHIYTKRCTYTRAPAACTHALAREASFDEVPAYPPAIASQRPAAYGECLRWRVPALASACVCTWPTLMTPPPECMLHACACACMHTCIHAYTHTCIHAYTHTCPHAYMHTCTHAHMHTCTHAHMHTCLHAGGRR